MIAEAQLQELRARYQSILKNELHVGEFEVDSLGDFSFYYKEHHTYLIFHADDPGFVRFLCGVYLVPGNDLEQVALAEASANLVNNSIKAVKIFRELEKNAIEYYSIMAAVEIFIDDVSSLKTETVHRILITLKQACADFETAFDGEDAQ